MGEAPTSPTKINPTITTHLPPPTANRTLNVRVPAIRDNKTTRLHQLHGSTYAVTASPLETAIDTQSHSASGKLKKRERPLQGGELVRTPTPQHDSDPPHQPHHTFGYMTDHTTTLGHQSRQATQPNGTVPDPPETNSHRNTTCKQEPTEKFHSPDQLDSHIPSRNNDYPKHALRFCANGDQHHTVNEQIAVQVPTTFTKFGPYASL